MGTACARGSVGSLGRSFTVEPLSYFSFHIVLLNWRNKGGYFSFQPVLYDWYNKGCGMCYYLYDMVHIKEPLLLLGKSSPCGGSGFPLSLFEWSFTICPTPYNRKIKCVECVVK